MAAYFKWKSFCCARFAARHRSRKLSTTKPKPAANSVGKCPTNARQCVSSNSYPKDGRTNATAARSFSFAEEDDPNPDPAKSYGIGDTVHMFTSQPIGFVGSPYKTGSEIPKGLG